MTQYINAVTYDEEVDAAYIRFVRTDANERLTTATMQNRPIHLDFDKEGRLVGVEVLSATEYLPAKLLDGAERL